ncbi:MAG: ATP-dependent helicase [Gemmatimonadaceae bacterium]
MSAEPRHYPARVREVTARTQVDFAAELNEAQLAAATHADGPLLIVAGAGTGKTRTLVYRVAHLIESGIRPERILLLTFTRRSAQEMLARAEKLVGNASRSVQGGTFHGTAHRLLRRFGPEAGLPGDFTILDQGDAVDLMQLSRAALGLGDKTKRFPKKETLHHVYSRHVNTEYPVGAILREEYPRFVEFEEDIARLFADYTERKLARNLVDYDDLLLYWAMLLDSPAASAVADRMAGLYSHILVDEYQDTNVLQSRILKGMCRAHRNITVVGDDAQSIYAFRGATIRNILDFPADFPGAAVVTLEQNYRSTQPILDATNMLISRAEERYSKELFTRRTGGELPWLVTAQDESQQTRFVVDRILELHEEGTPLREMAVLIRAGYMSADLEIELTARGIPFEKWGGIKFLEAAHVKDVLAFLRVIENPRDEVSWYRLLLLMPGIGETTARNAVESMLSQGWAHDSFAAFAAPARARDAHAALSALLTALRSDPAGGEGSTARDIARIRTLYDDILRDRYDRPEPRLADLERLMAIADGFQSRADFLSAITLDPPASSTDLGFGSDNEDDTLVISTAHSAKGREWDAVFLIWAVDGWFPMSRALGSEEEIEEERRLMYVAMTRARDHLAVVHPFNVYETRRGSSYSLAQLSRFLDRGVVRTFQQVVLEAAPDAAPITEATVTETVDVRALLRARFAADAQD